MFIYCTKTRVLSRAGACPDLDGPRGSESSGAKEPHLRKEKWIMETVSKKEGLSLSLSLSPSLSVSIYIYIQIHVYLW